MAIDRDGWRHGSPRSPSSVLALRERITSANNEPQLARPTSASVLHVPDADRGWTQTLAEHEQAVQQVLKLISVCAAHWHPQMCNRVFDALDRALARPLGARNMSQRLHVRRLARLRQQVDVEHDPALHHQLESQVDELRAALATERAAHAATRRAHESLGEAAAGTAKALRDSHVANDAARHRHASELSDRDEALRTSHQEMRAAHAAEERAAEAMRREELAQVDERMNRELEAARAACAAQTSALMVSLRDMHRRLVDERAEAAAAAEQARADADSLRLEALASADRRRKEEVEAAEEERVRELAEADEAARRAMEEALAAAERRRDSDSERHAEAMAAAEAIRERDLAVAEARRVAELTDAEARRCDDERAAATKLTATIDWHGNLLDKVEARHREDLAAAAEGQAEAMRCAGAVKCFAVMRSEARRATDSRAHADGIADLKAQMATLAEGFDARLAAEMARADSAHLEALDAAKKVHAKELAAREAELKAEITKHRENYQRLKLKRG